MVIHLKTMPRRKRYWIEEKDAEDLLKALKKLKERVKAVEMSTNIIKAYMPDERRLLRLIRRMQIRTKAVVASADEIKAWTGVLKDR
jgi:pyruvate-formate lyase-activating enzyme